MNEEKEELKKQVEKLQAQVTMSNAQVRAAGPGRGTSPTSWGQVGWVRGSPMSLGAWISRYLPVLLPALVPNISL